MTGWPQKRRPISRLPPIRTFAFRTVRVPRPHRRFRKSVRVLRAGATLEMSRSWHTHLAVGCRRTWLPPISSKRFSAAPGFKKHESRSNVISRGFSRKETDLMVVLDFLASYGHQDVHHGLTQKELAEATKIPEASIGPIVEQCVKQGWVARESWTRGLGLGGTEYVIYLRQAGWAVAQPVR